MTDNYILSATTSTRLGSYSDFFSKFDTLWLTNIIMIDFIQLDSKKS